MVGETGFEPATPWSRTQARGIARDRTERTPSQPVESPTLGGATVSHPAAPDAPVREAYTAGSLRASTLPSALPSFLEACANLASEAARREDLGLVRELVDKAARAAALPGETS